MKSKKILIIGTGAWGTALGSVLYDNGHEVKMYGTNINEVNDLKKGRNNNYFRNKNINFNPKKVSTNFEDVINDTDYIIFAIPTNAYKSFLDSYKKQIKKDTILVIASKGLEPNTQKPLYDFIKNEITNKVCLILGPSFAKEVINRKNTYVNTISEDLNVANTVANIFNNKNFLVKPITDYHGAAALGSFKNALAILFGLLDYQKVSINTKSAILALAIQEIKKYIIKIGGNVSTINEFCGIGDIFLTCTDSLSRNYQFGYDIGDVGIKKVIQRNDVTVEGYKFITTFFKDKNNKKKDYHIFYSIFEIVTGKLNHKKIVEHIWEIYHHEK